MTEASQLPNPPERGVRPTARGAWVARWLLARLVVLTWVYATALAGLLFVRCVYGDRAWWAFALNALLLYAFLPLPLVPAVALAARRREAWLIFAAGAAFWAWQWGGLFLPRAPVAHAGGPTLTVMSYNVLGYNFATAAVLDVIRAADADIVALQELNPLNAAAIERELKERYPYQILDPRPGVSGAGVLSRYPVRVTGETVPDDAWVSPPHVLEVEVAGRTLTLVRFHAIANPANWAPRNRQARRLAEFAGAHRPGPLILIGDLNATDQNEAYALVTGQLRDAWREAGWGFGHTFPGEPTEAAGGSRPAFAGIAVPMWLVRIDYVFHSDALVALDARLGPYDGASDHRPLIADLLLKP